MNRPNSARPAARSRITRLIVLTQARRLQLISLSQANRGHLLRAYPAQGL